MRPSIIAAVFTLSSTPMTWSCTSIACGAGRQPLGPGLPAAAATGGRGGGARPSTSMRSARCTSGPLHSTRCCTSCSDAVRTSCSQEIICSVEWLCDFHDMHRLALDT